MASCKECFHYQACKGTYYEVKECGEFDGEMYAECGCDDFLPTADVVEVKHGEWVDDGFGRGNMICSVCEQYQAEDENGNPLASLAYWEPRICPNCGAKMDGERRDT